MDCVSGHLMDHLQRPLNDSTYRSLTLRSNPLCLGSAFVVGLEVASATARSTRYAERPPSDRGLGLDPINCTTYFTAQVQEF